MSVEEVEKYLSWTWTGMEMTGKEMTEKEEEEEGRKITEYNIRTVTPHAADYLAGWLAPLLRLGLRECLPLIE